MILNINWKGWERYLAHCVITYTGTLGAPIPKGPRPDALGLAWDIFERTMNAQEWTNLVKASHYATSVIRWNTDYDLM